MFDEIFKRWINTGQIYQSDIVPILLEWNQVFGDGKATTESATIAAQFGVDIPLALKQLGIKKGYEWSELYSPDGRFLARFWQVNPDEIEK